MNKLQKIARIGKLFSSNSKYALSIQPSINHQISFKFSNKSDDDSHNDFKP